MNVIEKEIMIGSLYAVLFIPDVRDKLPCVILSHGIFSSYEMTAPSARELSKLGFACVCFDFHGCSYSNKSGGDLLSCSVLTETYDLEVIIEWVKVQDFCDINRLYLLGQSLGGVVSALAGVKRQNDLAGMVLMYPAFNFVDFISQQFKELNKIPEVTEDFLGVPGMNLGRKFFADALNTDFKRAVNSFSKPVLILHGTNDRLVPASYSEKAVLDYKNAELVIVDGGEHGFNLSLEQAKKVKSFLAV